MVVERNAPQRCAAQQQGKYFKFSDRGSMGNTESKTQESGGLPEPLTTAFTKILELIAAERYALALLEDYFSPKPASLALSSQEGKALEKRASQVVARFGGPPQRILIIRANDGSDDGKTEHFDDYPAAAMAEIVNMFHRTRRAVCRAQMLLVGNHFLHQDPDIFIAKMPPEVEKSFLESIDSSFWEQAEIAYIRLASYWDRVGQMLDFAFFSIRQFERDGFTAVADRIHTNFGPMDSILKAMPEWKALRAFQTSEKEDGLKWLLRRRNLLVHSLYLRPLSDSLPIDDGEVLFTSEFNHLEESLRRRLAPGTPTQEIERLNFQLAKAAELYPAVLGVCEYAADRRASIAGRCPNDDTTPERPRL
jgi:hypothetical protein